MTLSPLQKRIIELSSKVIETNDPAEFQRLASELRLALQEQVSNLRAMVREAKRNISQFPSNAYPMRNGTDD